MDMLERIPTIADDALGNLHANALRLERTGTHAQRASAAALLPAIEAELAARKAAKAERQAEARRAAPARSAKPPAKRASRRRAPEPAVEA
jgi:hypothetical protein